MKLPEPIAGFQWNQGWRHWEQVIPAAMREEGVVPMYTEAQMREALAQQYDEMKQLQEQNTALDARLALYERIRQKPDQVVEEIMGLAFKMAGMIQHVKHAPDGKERRHQAVDDLEHAVTKLDNIASELQDTCDRQAKKLASQEAVMRMALDALKQWEDAVTFTDRIKACNPTIAAIKALGDALGT